MVVGCVVRYEVEDHTDPTPAWWTSSTESARVPSGGFDAVVVGDVVALGRGWRQVDRVEPKSVDTETGEVVEAHVSP